MAEFQLDEMEFLIVQQGDKPVGTRRPHQMLFAFESLCSRFGHILSQWFEQCQKFQGVRMLFFSHYYNPRMYPEVHMLNLVQALEAYHRERQSGTYVPPDRYDEWRRTIVDAIPEDVPSDLRQALESRLDYGNEYSLRKRLHELLDGLGKDAQDLITSHYDDFVDYVVLLRNYHTHYTQELRSRLAERHKGRLPSGIHYIYLNWRLKAWLTMLMLKDLGIVEEEVVQRMGAVRRWQYFLSLGGI